jgi:hypothetical protein
MRDLIALACLAIGVSLPAGPSDMTAARIPDRAPLAAPAVRDDTPLVNEAEVRVWLDKWQKRLSLEEWTIEAKIVRIWDLPQGAVANIHWSLPKRKATIKVLNSIDSSLKRSEIPRDTELSVVHELVHLSMARLPLDPNHTELEEETVKKISTALLDLQDRQNAEHQIQSAQTR